MVACFTFVTSVINLIYSMQLILLQIYLTTIIGISPSKLHIYLLQCCQYIPFFTILLKKVIKLKLNVKYYFDLNLFFNIRDSDSGPFHRRTACIRHLCRKTADLNCHRCLINTGIEKMNNI